MISLKWGIIFQKVITMSYPGRDSVRRRLFPEEEEETNQRIEELVAKRVEEELEKRKDEIEREVLRRVESAKEKPKDPKDEVYETSSDNSEEEEEMSDEDEYEVEAIVGKKTWENGEVEYQLQWKGWPNPDDYTWEPISNLKCQELIEKYEAKLKESQESQEDDEESEEEEEEEEQEEQPKTKRFRSEKPDPPGFTVERRVFGVLKPIKKVFQVESGALSLVGIVRILLSLVESFMA